MNEETLFEQAARLPVAERVAWLDQQCAGQPELRARVAELLAADEASRVPLDRLLVVADATRDYAPSSGAESGSSAVAQGRLAHQAGTVVGGKYTLVEAIGDGGMGSVWRAKQSEPVKRFVAVKLIKAGMDSRQVLARFEAERQALALMDHPNIAKVLDGGLHDQRPYFVMELVKGAPITEYCDHHRLTPRQRLELFVQACQAIQHAHQKGIIHRDIKPSNVLVALYDDRPVVKVIDFGVAKATGGALTEATIDTGFGGVVGTPQYMSPEQATLNNLDIDTRSDVYALGVLLYELLVGSPPFSSDELKKKGFIEILRVVREEDPPRPSTKLSTADALPSLSANRGTEPKKLTVLLRNELDWIVMKALEKDRARRYETANGFAADVQRFLAGEAVTAHPPSAAYRVRKFVRRHQGQVVAASLVLVALIAGVLGTTAGLLEARRQAAIAREEALAKETARAAEAEQRETAETNERKAVVAAEQERLAKTQIASQLKQIELINDTVFEIFGGFDIRRVREGNEPVEAVLAKKLIEAGRKLDDQAIADPLTLARLRNHLGVTLLGLGFATDAIELFVAARATISEKLGPDHLETLDVMQNLAHGYHFAGRLDLALPLFEETLERRKVLQGIDDPETLSAMHGLAASYSAAGKYVEAQSLWEEKLSLAKRTLGSDDPSVLTAMSNLALTHLEAGRPDLALPLFEQTLATMKDKLGPDHVDTLACICNLAMAYRDTGQAEKGLAMLEEAYALHRAKLGPEHPATLICRNNRALCLMAIGKTDEALAWFEETLRLNTAKLGPDHPATLNSMSNLAEGYQSAGNLDRALPLYEETLRRAEAALGRDHPVVVGAASNLARAYHSSKKMDKALPLFERVLPIYKARFGADSDKTLSEMSKLAETYRAVGKSEQAFALFEELLRLCRARFGPDDQTTLLYVEILAGVQRSLGRVQQSQPLLEELLQARKVKLGPNHVETLRAMSNLAVSYRETGKLRDALPLLNESVERSKTTLGVEDPQTLLRMSNLAACHWSLRQLDESIPIFEETLRLQQKVLGRDHVDAQSTAINLGVNYKDAGRVAEAITLLEEAYTAATDPGLKQRSARELFFAYVKASERVKARRLIDDLVVQDRRDLPPDSPQLAVRLAQFAQLMLEIEGYAEAERLLRETLAICEKTQPDAWTTFNAKSMLGGALLGQQKYAEAKPLLTQGYEGMKAREREVKASRGGERRITEALDRLIALSTATGRPDEAVRFRELRKDYSAKEQPR